MLRTRQRFGKYVIQRKLGEGGFAAVYEARDTIEGIRVALKVPYAHLVTGDTMHDFRRACASACLRRSARSVRLGKSVSASW